MIDVAQAASLRRSARERLHATRHFLEIAIESFKTVNFVVTNNG